MWQIVVNLEFVTGFAIDLQTRKPNISPVTYTTGCIKKTEQILNCSQRREAAKSMKFLINIQSVTLKLGTLTSKRHFLIYLWKIHL